MDSQVGDVNTDISPAAFKVGGTVSGLEGTALVLQNNTGESASVSMNGAFTFATSLPRGAVYMVTVKTQPSSPTQTCTVASGSGAIEGANVTDVAVTCTTERFTVGGTVGGLAGTGLVLRNNGGDQLTMNANGSFTFATPIASGSAYTVTVQAQPTLPTQVCTVTNGTGTLGAAAVANVGIACETTGFTIAGTVAGLAAGATLVLRNNAGDDLALAQNGVFAFVVPVPSGASYAVTVLTQPSVPSQTCTLTAGSGSVTNADVENVAVTCVTNSYAVGGSLSGLAAGATVMLQDNAANQLARSSNGAFVFAAPVASGASYAVSVLSHPSSPVQSCVVANGSGTVGATNITTVSIVCVTTTFTVGGNVAGLVGAGLVLRNNGGDSLPISASGSFVFGTPVESGAAYVVTVSSQPTGPSQTCSVAAPSGTVAAGNLTGITVTCATNNFTVGGTVSGLSGTVALRNNDADELVLTANGPFTFGTPIPSGGAYAVTVQTQPASPSQTCVVTIRTGTVGSADVTGVIVTCTTHSFTIGGAVSGLSGSGLVLRNNGGDDLPVSANGGFTFASSIPSGGGYAVTVLTRPASPSQSCSITSGSGTVAAANVTNITITCVTTGGSGSGSDGPLSVVGSVVINTTSAAATGTSGEMTLTLGSSTGFAAGQSILIHQSQGTNAGDWERATVVSVGGDVLTLAQPLGHSYVSSGASDHAQAIVAPQYTDVTVPLGESLSAPPWNGITGGILAFNASGTVTVAGTVSMKGAGFRGGIGSTVDPGTVAFKTQGESFTGLGASGSSTNVPNAGGGNGGAKQGGCEGGGGGGGAHATDGANGGPHTTCFPLIEGGVGGTAYGDAALARILFGSGGGAGGYSGDPSLGRGGNGGGIVMIFGNQITITSSIDAPGDDGTLEYGDYGGGGGGAGGSVYVSHVQPLVGAGNVSVAGGVGGLANGRSEVGGDGAIGRAVAVQ